MPLTPSEFSHSLQQPRNLLAIFSDPGVLLVLIATSMVFWKLGEGSLKDWDEAIYGEVSKEIIQSGHWLTLQRGYVPWFHKPPLFMWATAILYKFFGIDEFWSRAASAISCIGLIFVTYQIGKVVYGRWVGIVSGIILLTASGFLAPARLGMTDIMLTFFVFTTIYGYVRLDTDSLRWWTVIWVSSGLALMTKGAAGLIAPQTLFDANSFELLLEGPVIRRPNRWTLAYLDVFSTWTFVLG